MKNSSGDVIPVNPKYASGTNITMVADEPLVKRDNPLPTDCRQVDINVSDQILSLFVAFPGLQPGKYTLDITLAPRGQSQSDSDRLSFTVP